MSVPIHVRRFSLWQLRQGERRLILILGDLLISILALGIALYYWASADRWFGLSFEFLEKRPTPWFYLLPVIWILLLIGLYDTNSSVNLSQTVRGILLAAIIGLGIYLLLYFTSPPNSLPRRGVLAFLIPAAILTLAWRYLYIRIFTAPASLRRVLVVGGGKSGENILSIINSVYPPPFNIVGIVDDDPLKQGVIIEDVRVLGNSEQLLQLVAECQVTDILVAIIGEMQGGMFQALLDAHERGVEVTRMQVTYEDLLGRVPIRYLEADWILRSFVDQTRVTGFYRVSKRLVDIFGGVIGTLLLLAIMPFVAIAILLDDGHPIFYTQIRSGRAGSPYRIFKFRTMKTDAEADGIPQWAREDDARATRTGRVLRRTHLDELPQFINVLRGEMSLVGPRAERPELVELFQHRVPFYRSRLLVKPGITGWAQINYGYASTIDETIVKLEYDLYYIKHRNLLLDLIILLRTPATIFGFRGR